MFYYKVIHKYKSDDRDEKKEIGVFSSKEKAFQAIDAVKDKPGFIDRPDGFSVKRILRPFKPLLADQIFWCDGFDTYYFNRRANEICCDEEKNLMKYFTFLLTEYGFRFDKLELGDLVDENGKRWFSESPILGYGMNNYKVMNLPATGRYTYAHNNFIEIAVDLGVIGFALYYFVYAYLAVRLLKRIKEDRLYVFLLSALIASLLSHYGDVAYYDFYQNFLLLICFYAANKTKSERAFEQL